MSGRRISVDQQRSAPDVSVFVFLFVFVFVSVFEPQTNEKKISWQMLLSKETGRRI